jgi:hypothetical protein
MEEWSVTIVSEGGANTLHTKKKPKKKPSNPDDRSGPDQVRICRPGYLALQTEKRREKKGGKKQVTRMTDPDLVRSGSVVRVTCFWLQRAGAEQLSQLNNYHTLHLPRRRDDIWSWDVLSI